MKAMITVFHLSAFFSSSLFVLLAFIVDAKKSVRNKCNVVHLHSDDGHLMYFLSINWYWINGCCTAPANSQLCAFLVHACRFPHTMRRYFSNGIQFGGKLFSNCSYTPSHLISLACKLLFSCLCHRSNYKLPWISHLNRNIFLICCERYGFCIICLCT